MSVVFRVSTRKMTPKNKLLVLFAAVGWLEGICGAAFSNVLVQRHEVVPVEYINYNPPPIPFPNSQLAQLSAPSLSALVSPCATPCVIPDSPVPRLVPIPSSNAKIITYKPSVPSVVVTNKEAARGYQYAYAVFDDQTGDKKSQSEQSNGSVVQGQYSFIQPDGFRREVIYTADDKKGFNAIVKNISPEPPQDNKEDKVVVVKQPATPCPGPKKPKHEHLKHEHGFELSSEELEVEALQLDTKKKDDEIPEKKEENITETSVVKVEKPEEKKENPEEVIPATPPAVPDAPSSNPVILYNDILKCLQAKLQGNRNVVSPLTYVLIPSLNGPC